MWEPYRLLDSAGTVVAPVAVYLKDLQGIGRPVTTQRSYGMDLLRWFRFLWAVQTPWDQATRDEARDFSRWIQISDKPRRAGASVASAVPNPVTGKTGPGRRYAPTTCGHSESVLRGFYNFHQESSSGPMVNPFPLVRRGARVRAHHNPIDLYRNERSGLYRPRHVQRVPRSIPDEMFNKLFAQLGSHRDRAGVSGRRLAPSGRRRWRAGRNGPAANRAWTSGHVSGCPSCRSWCGRSTPSAGWQPSD